jgi:hypothetical protein
MTITQQFLHVWRLHDKAAAIKLYGIEPIIELKLRQAKNKWRLIWKG